MSKIAFTIVLPHDSKDNNRTPGFYISTSNLTYLNVKGSDFKAARWGNGNTSSGWKSRFEYGVTASKGATKLSLIMNTSVILPPVSWALPIMGEDPPPKKKEEEGKNKGASKALRASSASEHPPYRSGSSSRGSRENGSGKPRRDRDRERDRDTDRERNRERNRQRDRERDRDEYPERRRTKAPGETVRWITDREESERHQQRHSRERRKRYPNTDPGLVDIGDR
ncbi:hypothetical protein LZ554_008264 [Drepanopeziza brunnea f. sp. 'monogermtubi']|nr:hypothetical protein LZ554_008264 [Drepanopeziza brunnea f. sp. 'monogermtubi']